MDDEKIYNAILDELHANGPRQGLWAKCFAEANGNENAAKALYFKYRAQQLVNQESPATSKSNSTDLAKHVASNDQSTSHTSQNNTVVLLLLALTVAFCIGWWLFSFGEKQDVVAASVNPFTANSSQITSPRSTNQEVEKSVSQSAFTETNQSSTNTADLNPKVNEFEIAGKAIEKELATKLHLCSRPCKIQIHDQSTIRRQTLCAIRRTNTHPTTHRRLYSHQNFAQRKPAKGFDPLCHNRSQ